MGKLKDWYGGLSKTGKVAVVSIVTLLTFGTIGAFAEPSTPTQKDNNPKVQSASTTPKIETKAITTTEPIQFTSTTVGDNTLEQGVTRVRTVGVNGVLSHTYQVTYTDGVETNRSKPVDSITKPVVNEVVAKGTKATTPSCPNGTYVNTAGSMVCRPYETSSTPSGATAQCVDGTYSFSQSRRGTCSHHGGVAEWL